jgi:carboxyl-terminal processing protease
MLPANVMGVGQHISPGIEATPIGVPTPCVNLGMHALAVPFCPTILFTAQPALNVASIVPVGPNVPPLVPPVFMHMNLVGIPTILLMGLPATSLLTPAVSSGPPGATLVPDVTTVLLMYAGPIGLDTESGPPRVTIEDLRAIQRSLSGPMVESALLAEGVGYVSIRRFSSSVPSAVSHQVQTLTARGMKSLVIDLRGNPGGEMDAFLQLAGDFLEEGSLIVTMTDSDGDEVEYHARQSNRYSFPVAVVVDGGTASAAEVFAGCLQAHGRAVVVGERTYGKGEAQAVIGSANGLIYATVASFTLPDGRSLQGIGVKPDVTLPTDETTACGPLAGCLPPALCAAIASLDNPASKLASDRVIV